MIPAGIRNREADICRRCSISSTPMSRDSSASPMAGAPPLSDEQREHIAALLRAGGSTVMTPTVGDARPETS